MQRHGFTELAYRKAPQAASPLPHANHLARAVLPVDVVSPYRSPAPVPPAAPSLFDLWPAALALAVGVAAFAVCKARDERTEFEDLTPRERASLLERSLDNLELCRRHRSAVLDHFCNEQAAVVRKLAQCGSTCREIAPDRERSRSSR